MADLYPSLPEKSYRLSRMLRVLVFSLVVSTLAVSAVIVLFRFVYEEFVSTYNDQGILLLLSILLFTFVLARITWDAAEGRVLPRRKK